MLCKVDDIISAHEEIFGKSWYALVNTRNIGLPAILADFTHQYSVLCIEVSDFDPKYPSQQNLLKSLGGGPQVAKLINTEKRIKIRDS